MATSPLHNKVALITGAGSPIGMGRAIALAYVATGAKVAMMDIDEPGLEQTARKVREIGGDAAASMIVGDTSDWSDAVRAVEHTLGTLGGLDVLVNLAGLHPRALLPATDGHKEFWDLPPDIWERIIAVNSTGPFLMARAAVGHMVAQGWGRVIGVTTSMDTMLRGIPYGPSKATHEALVAAMAAGLEGTGVTSNALLPGGGTNTMFVSRERGRDFVKLIQPEVMGPPAVWIASDASEGFNGVRIIAADWDENLSPEENLERSSAPAGWPQLGRRP